MLTELPDVLIDWKAFGETRDQLGASFVRVLGYFRDDGAKSVAAIEEALRLKESAKLVNPALTLKGEALPFGAHGLALLAEEIEFEARHYVELQIDPSDLIETIVQLRPMFEATLAALEAEASPLVERKSASIGQRNAFGGMGYG